MLVVSFVVAMSLFACEKPQLVDEETNSFTILLEEEEVTRSGHRHIVERKVSFKQVKQVNAMKSFNRKSVRAMNPVSPMSDAKMIDYKVRDCVRRGKIGLGNGFLIRGRTDYKNEEKGIWIIIITDDDGNVTGTYTYVKNPASPTGWTLVSGWDTKNCFWGVIQSVLNMFYDGNGNYPFIDKFIEGK